MPDVRSDVTWLGDRLREPSTYSGFAGIMMALHFAVPPGLLSAITATGTGIGGLIAFFLPEKS